MKDTTPEMEQIYREMLMSRTGAERMEMAAQSFEAARQMILASLSPDLSPAEAKVQLFLRLYQNDFTSEEQAKIIQFIYNSFSSSSTLDNT